MEKITYYEVPEMVKFWDIDGDHYIGGIAYQDKVICGCCGGTFDIEEIYEFAPDGIEPVQKMKWIDISEAILGD